MERTTRRETLRAGGTLAVLLAGCTGDDGGADSKAGTTSAVGESATATGVEPSTTAAGDGLDLREANVTAVAVEADGGDYRFDVTLYHDDDGEDGYANWWQVEDLDGERLGRRELLHSHGTREFTRSATVTVPDDAPCVVVRGHDRAHGYGGQAMLVTVETGATRARQQGGEPASFADADCP